MLKWIKRIFIVTLILIVSLICIALFYINKQNQSILKTKLEVNQDIQNKVASIAKKTKDFKIEKTYKIVGLGEYSHGNSKTQKLRKEIAQKLYEKGELSSIVLEIPYVDGKRVNEYIHGKSDKTIDEIMQDFTYFLYQTQEMKDLFLWLKQINDSGANISFYGIDIQQWDRPKDELNKTLAKLIVNKKIDVKDINVIKEIRNLLAQKALGEEKTSIMLNLKVLEQEINYEPTLEQTSNVNYTTDSANFRDKAMAENAMYIQNEEGKTILLLGHNAHISRESKMQKTMGGFIKEKLGNAYYSIGTQAKVTSFMARDTQMDFTSKKSHNIEQFSLKDKSEFIKAFGKVKGDSVISFDNLPKEVLDFYNQDHAMLSVGATFGIIQKIFYMGHYISVNPVLAYDVVYVFEQDEPYKFIDN
ncbi:erythromycin esterase family protein [Criibacterium bergeronii]|uniref:Erythromycin esterase family protein n=1 Tax=Criibacterium bergeronii TaxID=1871336 RepID=A0A371IM40_9FIRM|nr:erythromycin esterase family protein [Criibacterium bergeronii]RDY21573.1 hypothetical protein BBG48_004275 [Criibacterium bergeronii]